jgi:hypothetical protein
VLLLRPDAAADGSAVTSGGSAMPPTGGRGVAVGVEVAVAVGVLVGVGVGVFVGVAVGVLVGVLVGLGVGVFVGVNVGNGVRGITTLIVTLAQWVSGTIVGTGGVGVEKNCVGVAQVITSHAGK